MLSSILLKVSIESLKAFFPKYKLGSMWIIRKLLSKSDLKDIFAFSISTFKFFFFIYFQSLIWSTVIPTQNNIVIFFLNIIYEMLKFFLIIQVSRSVTTKKNWSFFGIIKQVIFFLLVHLSDWLLWDELHLYLKYHQ